MCVYIVNEAGTFDTNAAVSVSVTTVIKVIN